MFILIYSVGYPAVDLMNWISFIYSYLKTCIWFERGHCNTPSRLQASKAFFFHLMATVWSSLQLKSEFGSNAARMARWALAIIYQSDITFFNNKPHCLTAPKCKKNKHKKFKELQPRRNMRVRLKFCLSMCLLDMTYMYSCTGPTVSLSRIEVWDGLRALNWK